MEDVADCSRSLLADGGRPTLRLTGTVRSCGDDAARGVDTEAVLLRLYGLFVKIGGSLEGLVGDDDELGLGVAFAGGFIALVEILEFGGGGRFELLEVCVDVEVTVIF